MSNQKSNKKRQRTHKVSQGLRKSSGSVELTEVQKVIQGGGLLDSIKEIDCKPYRGSGGFGPPFDATQAAENRRLYPHLFDRET